MAYIGHRCGCGHIDQLHKQGATKSACEAKAGHSCGNGCRKSTKAVLIPTFDGKGRPVEAIAVPGVRMERMPWTPCDCDACQALCAELTGAEAAQ